MAIHSFPSFHDSVKVCLQAVEGRLQSLLDLQDFGIRKAFGQLSSLVMIVIMAGVIMAGVIMAGVIMAGVIMAGVIVAGVIVVSVVVARMVMSIVAVIMA